MKSINGPTKYPTFKKAAKEKKPVLAYLCFITSGDVGEVWYGLLDTDVCVVDITSRTDTGVFNLVCDQGHFPRTTLTTEIQVTKLKAIPINTGLLTSLLLPMDAIGITLITF